MYEVTRCKRSMYIILFFFHSSFIIPQYFILAVWQPGSHLFIKNVLETKFLSSPTT